MLKEIVFKENTEKLGDYYSRIVGGVRMVIFLEQAAAMRVSKLLVHDYLQVMLSKIALTCTLKYPGNVPYLYLLNFLTNYLNIKLFVVIKFKYAFQKKKYLVIQH